VEFLSSFLEDHRSATFILAAAVASSSVWANVAGGAYRSFLNTQVGVSLGSLAVGLSMREIPVRA
jgi:hypothetical protein